MTEKTRKAVLAAAIILIAERKSNGRGLVGRIFDAVGDAFYGEGAFVVRAAPGNATRDSGPPAGVNFDGSDVGGDDAAALDGLDL